MTDLSNTTVVAELPDMPPPEFQPFYQVVSFYVGPGFASNTWIVHRDQWKTEEAARFAAYKLARHHIHRRILKVAMP